MAMDYVKVGNEKRNQLTLTDDYLAGIHSRLTEAANMIADIVEGKETIASACRNHGFNMLEFRRMLVDLRRLTKPEMPVPMINRGDYEILLTPLEKLYCAIFNCDTRTTEVLNYMPEDALETVDAMLGEECDKYGMTRREANIVRKYYFDEQTLEEIGQSNGITRERVRQIVAKAIRKLRHPIRRNTLMLGLSMQNSIDEEAETRKIEMLDRLAEEKAMNDASVIKAQAELKEGEEMLNTDIEELELSVRSFNVLRRKGIYTYGDLLAVKDIDELKAMRNMGAKSVNEIVTTFRKIYPEFLRGNRA